MGKMQLAQYIWMEAFRPQSVKEMVLPKKKKIFFSKLISKGEISNMLLYSTSPGSGKSTLSKALCNDLESDYLYINASERTGIDTLRTDIKQFATTVSFSGRPKIVILDEIDSNSNLAMQKALRAFMEEFHKNCRFILTCNNITKVIEPLQSRCQLIDFNMSDEKTKNEMKPKILKRLITILKFKKVEYNEETLKKIIDIYYPDIRFMIKICQQFSDERDCINDEIFEMCLVDDEFYDMVLNKDFKSARKYLIDKNVNYDVMYKKLNDNLIPKIDKQYKARALHTIAEGMRWNAFSIDKEINFADTLLTITEDCI